MLVQSGRRPKEWTFSEGYGSYTVSFDGCPFKFKSAKMVDWLHALILSFETNSSESQYGFSPYERLEIRWEYVVNELEGELWVFEPQALPDGLYGSIMEAEEYVLGIDLFANLKNMYDDKCINGDLGEDIYWSCAKGALLCCVYMVEIAAEKTGDITDNIFAAFHQLSGLLDCRIEEAKEAGEEPEFWAEVEPFERLIKLIPSIEKCGNEELIRRAYKFARDFYRATHRQILAEQFSAKLNG